MQGSWQEPGGRSAPTWRRARTRARARNVGVRGRIRAGVAVRFRVWVRAGDPTRVRAGTRAAVHLGAVISCVCLLAACGPRGDAPEANRKTGPSVGASEGGAAQVEAGRASGVSAGTLTVTGTAGWDRTPEGQSVAELLAPGEHAADVMEVVVPGELSVLAQKFRQAVAAQPEWFAEWSRRHADVHPLPYHQNFGLTADEYARLNSAQGAMELRKKAESRLVFDLSPDAKVTLRGDALGRWSGTTVDLQSGILTTPLGITATRSPIEKTEDDRLTGPWTGVQWRMDTNPAVAPAAAGGAGGRSAFSWSLGRTKRDGRGLLYARHVSSDANGRRSEETIVLSYDLWTKGRDRGL